MDEYNSFRPRFPFSCVQVTSTPSSPPPQAPSPPPFPPSSPTPRSTVNRTVDFAPERDRHGHTPSTAASNRAAWIPNLLLTLIGLVALSMPLWLTMTGGFSQLMADDIGLDFHHIGSKYRTRSISDAPIEGIHFPLSQT